MYARFHVYMYMLTQYQCVPYTRRDDNRRWYIKIWSVKWKFIKIIIIITIFFFSFHIFLFESFHLVSICIFCTNHSVIYGLWKFNLFVMVSRKSFSCVLSLSLAVVGADDMELRARWKIWRALHESRNCYILFNRIIYGRWTLRIARSRKEKIIKNDQRKMVEERMKKKGREPKHSGKKHINTKHENERIIINEWMNGFYEKPSHSSIISIHNIHIIILLLSVPGSRPLEDFHHANLCVNDGKCSHKGDKNHSTLGFMDRKTPFCFRHKA